MTDFVHMLPIPEPLLALVRALLRSEEPPPWPEGISIDDEQRLIDALVEHGVIALVYGSLSVAQRDRVLAWPAPVSEELRRRAIHAAAVEAFRLSDLQLFLRAVDDVGARALILKGTALAYSIYAAPELRQRGDTDVLIDRAMLDLLRERLLLDGFTERLTSADELAFRQTMFLHRDAFGLEHGYDVHWAIANTPVVADALTPDELVERSVVLPRIGHDVRGLSHADALLLACIHRVAHHHDSDRLIWLYDIHLLRQAMSEDEHRQFWLRAAERGVVTIARASIEKTEEWFGQIDAPAAETFLAATVLEASEPSSAFLRQGRTYGSTLLADFAALPDWRRRLQRARQLAFPPAAFMRESFGVRTKTLLPLLYLWRGVRGVVRLAQRVGTRR
jgi:hypothetical protein